MLPDTQLYILFSLTFQRAVKFVELISSCSNMVATQKFNKINEVYVLATCVTRNSVYLIRDNRGLQTRLINSISHI